MSNNNFEKSLKIPKIVLGWAGIKIFQKKQDRGVEYLKESWIFYFNLTWLCSAVLGEFYWLTEGIYSGRSFDELCTCAPCFTICILIIVKINCLYFNRDIVENVVDKLRTIHPEDDKKESEYTNKGRRIIKDALQFLNTVLRYSFYLDMVVLIVFGSASILSMAYGYIFTGNIVFNLPFRIKYFFEVSSLRRWLLAYIHQIGALIISSIDLVSADILFYALCTYLRMHFRLLCLQFENVVVKDSEADTKKNFRMAVKRHQELIELVEQIELLYSKSTLCHIILSSLLICLSGFIITFVDDISVVSSFVTFLAMNLTQISLLCYFGDMLNSSSIRVTQAIYNSLWYDAELNIKKGVVVVIIRAQTSCKVTAMKFADLNLNALSAILRTSWSYFALLKTMYD